MQLNCCDPSMTMCNDTLREVAQRFDQISQGLALQARASGTPFMAPRIKKICRVQVKLALLARCKINRYGQSELHSGRQLEDSRKKRTRTFTSLCAEFSINSNLQIELLTHKRSHPVTTGIPSPGAPGETQEPGRNPKKAESPRAAIVPAA